MMSNEIGDQPRRLIVAGLDESACARIAVDWAADEAVRHRAVLHLVHAHPLPTAGFPGHKKLPDYLDRELREADQELLDRVVADLGRSHPGLPVSTNLSFDRPVEALRRESRSALLTVVGARGTARVFGQLLGSVASAITSRNPVPVAVIHSGCTTTASGPVVVGIDDYPNSEQAIAFAFEEAALRDAPLVAVHAWTGASTTGAQAPMVVAPAVEIQEEHTALLAERLAGWSDKYPEVTVQQALVARRPLAALLSYADRAQLIVVGSHGRGSFAGLLLGSTGRSLVAHCTCPVVIVTPTPAR